MKIRTDFVTNSSSSSFILGFKDSADLNKMLVKCKDIGRKDIYDLVLKLMKRQEEYTKGVLKGITDSFYIREYMDDIILVLHPEYLDLDIVERIRLENICKETSEFKDMLSEKLKSDKSYVRFTEKLGESSITIYGVIWDTDDTEPENSIRAGLLREEFNDWLVMQYDVG